MPYLRANAPACIPDEETLEVLLGERNTGSPSSAVRKNKTFHELDADLRARTNLVTLDTRQEVIPGDPYGIHPAWAGNIGHPDDLRMFSVLEPIFAQINACVLSEGECVRRLENFLAAVPGTHPIALAAKYADKGSDQVLCDSSEETTVTFQLGSKSVRILHANDIDKNDAGSYSKSRRADSSNCNAEQAFGEPDMSVTTQKYMVAMMIKDGKAPEKPKDKAAIKKWLGALRVEVREHYWLKMNKAERLVVQEQATAAVSDKELEQQLAVVSAHWGRLWTNNSRDPDHFRQYLVDRMAAEKTWTLVKEDILIITDVNHETIFASIENLMDDLFGPDIHDLLVRAIDLWSFYTPLPQPDTKRHVLDNHIRRKVPELDMSRVTVDQLQNAKMFVAHYGCWGAAGHKTAQKVYLSPDAKFSRSSNLDNCQELFPSFAKGVLRKTSDLIRFMMQRLDPTHYNECREVFEALPTNRRVVTSDEDFLSLFAIGWRGYTQRHRDDGDESGGLAGLVTLGNYEGGNLCIPQFGLKVQYRPGACAIIRGSEVDHLVTDYVGLRIFNVGTNHETTRRYAFRAMGKLAAPDDDGKRRPHSSEQEDSDSEMGTKGPCVNDGDDDRDSNLETSERQIHGPRALDYWSTSGSSSSSTQNQVDK